MSETIRDLTIGEMSEVYHKRMVVDFPRSELKPWFRIEQLMKDGNYAGYGLFDSEELKAYAFIGTAPETEYVLLDYYAVDEQSRGQGFGSHMLIRLRETLNADGILVETEDISRAYDDAERTVRVKRNSFYTSNGAERTGIRVHLFGVDYEIFDIPVNRTGSEDERREGLKKIYKVMLPGIHYYLHVRFY